MYSGFTSISFRLGLIYVNWRSRIEFGTAGTLTFEKVSACLLKVSVREGLRGRMEAGWARMNDLIVIQASQVIVYEFFPRDASYLPVLHQGLCAYVLENVQDAATRGIVVGHDHRHHSDRWAKLTAVAFVDKGVRVYLFDGLVHTPL